MKAWMLLVVLLLAGLVGSAEATDRGLSRNLDRAVRAAQLQRDIDRELALRELALREQALRRQALRRRAFFGPRLGFGLFF